MGETFRPDLHTGTGNFSVPLDLPPGRNGFTPDLALTYSTGDGNGPFGLGWGVTVPSITRKTSAGVPRYRDGDPDPARRDVFVLQGFDDLVPVPGASTPGAQRFRPRTEGAFGRIEHRAGGGSPAQDVWEVRSPDGRRSFFGGLDAGGELAVVADPDPNRSRIFAWALTRIEDPFGNRIEYVYERDAVRQEPPPRAHRWDQLYLREVWYADHGDPVSPEFLVKVRFRYEPRPDPFSEHRSGFEIRTVRRCRRIEVSTYPGGLATPERAYTLGYADPPPLNRASLLASVDLTGLGSGGSEAMPPLELGYTEFDPERRRDLRGVGARQLPARPLADPHHELADVSGDGLPDLVEIDGQARYWRNLGEGAFDVPRSLRRAPAGVRLGDPGVQLADADGDGRVDVLVTRPGAPAGHFPLTVDPAAARFRRFTVAPTFSLDDPAVRMLDLTGDGVTDALRSGSSLECYFTDPEQGWSEAATRRVARRRLEEFPDLHFSDPRVRWADMNGDGLVDPVLVHDRVVDYWPAAGHGEWGPRVTMGPAPDLPLAYDPRRLLIGDVDGDGLADLVYVGSGDVTLWVNQGGNGFSDAVTIAGTPAIADLDSLRLTDLLGSGVGGLLWSADSGSAWPHPMYFLDFTGGGKPYLLARTDNNLGATSTIAYAPSTRFHVPNTAAPTAGGRASLPFPVQVVGRVEVHDALSDTTLSTEYSYRHGHWDGRDREFRGFGRVEELDVARDSAASEQPDPVLTRTWFHVGAVPSDDGGWEPLSVAHEYFAGDSDVLTAPAPQAAWLAALPASARHDALRALRGRPLRSERYVLDGTAAESRPHAVTETAHAVAPLPVDQPPPAAPAPWQTRVFFPHVVAERVTTWERGDDPHTQITFTDAYDRHGQPRERTVVACPRRQRRRGAMTAAVVGQVTVDDTRMLAVHTRTEYATADQGLELHDRVAHERTFALAAAAGVTESDPDDLAAVLIDQGLAARRVHRAFTDTLRPWSSGQQLPAGVRLLTHDLHRYDGAAFTGRPIAQVGPYGARTCSESLVFDDGDLDAAYGTRRPDYLGGPAALPGGAPATFGADLGYRLQTASTAGHHDGWYAFRERRRLDFQLPAAQQARGLVVGLRDPLGNETALSPDPYWLFPASITDPLGLTTDVTYDRLELARITDPNGHATRVRYSPLGLVRQVIHEARDGDGGTTARPEIEFTHDLGAYSRTRDGPSPQPVFVHARRRVWHAGDPRGDDSVVEVRQYSDGFGRLLQARADAEELAFGAPDGPGDDVGLSTVAGEQPSPAIASVVTGRVTVSEWQTYDAKGRVTARYEPSSAIGWNYQPEAEARRGHRTLTSHDALGRRVRTVRPDGTEERVVHGVPASLSQPGAFAPSAWEAVLYDANDLAPLSSGPGGASLAAAAPAAHHFTPTTNRLDGFGRAVATLLRAGPEPSADWLLTRFAYDDGGRVAEVRDAVGRVALRQRYDRLDRALRVESVDAGVATSVFDAAGNLVDHEDADGRRALRRYDAANRLAELWARDAPTLPVTLRERLIYGDQLADTGAARQQNRLGRIARHYDEAGVQETTAYDGRGNPRARRRRVISDAALTAGWTADWAVAGSENALEARAYAVDTRYDALDRLVELRAPDDDQGQSHRPLYTLIYGKGGTLSRADIDGTAYVRGMAHDAHGQRVIVLYGNGIMTRHAYDPRSRRLARTRSEPSQETAQVTGRTWTGVGSGEAHRVLQDVAYSHDPTGNVTSLDERVPGCGVAGSPDGRDRLRREFRYDAVYRLLWATGRACAAIPVPRPLEDLRRCGSYVPPPAAAPNQHNAPDLTERYRETFAWDPVTNLVSMTHHGDGSTWTRAWGVGGVSAPGWLGAASNRATELREGGTVHTYGYDAAGNLEQADADRTFSWDHAGRLVAFTRRAGSGPPSVEARYLYGADGARVKRWVRSGGSGAGESTVYVDRFFEHHPDNAAGPSVLLHLLDGDRRLALVRHGPADPRDAGPAVQYHLEDHVRSSHVVVGASGAWVNREEYFPFGETSFGSFARKRYRFTGRERDAETGLDHHDARFYAPWLGRWISCDPAGLADGPNLYAYARGSPIGLVDPSGLQAEGAQQQAAEQRRTHVIIVGTDDASHADPTNFPRAVDTLLNQSTREGFRESVKEGDHIVVLVPPSMSRRLVRQIEGALQRFKDGIDPRAIRAVPPPPGEEPNTEWFHVTLGVTTEVRKVSEVDVAKVVNEQRAVRNLFYFGHGAQGGPLYDKGGRTDFPAADAFKAETFAPDARAVFATCNSWKYAEKFTQATGVPATGVEGTTFYGRREISAGVHPDHVDAGTSVSWTFQRVGRGVVPVGPQSLSQRRGVPFLRLQNEPQPLAPPRPLAVPRR